MAGRNFKINQISNSMPKVDDVLTGWMIDFVANFTKQVRIDGEFVETSKFVKMQGVLQPLSAEDISLKPEGQRNWKWYQLHVPIKYQQLPVGKIVKLDNINYKIMAAKDYKLNGYTEYHCIKDYEGLV